MWRCYRLWGEPKRTDQASPGGKGARPGLLPVGWPPQVPEDLRGRRGSLLVKEFPLWRADKRQSSGVSLLNPRHPLISGRGAEAPRQVSRPCVRQGEKPSPCDPSWRLELGRQVPGATLETKSGQAGSTSLNNGFRRAPARSAHASVLGCAGALPWGTPPRPAHAIF